MVAKKLFDSAYPRHQFFELAVKNKIFNLLWESHPALSANLSSLAPQPLSARYPLSRHSRCHVTWSPHKRLNPLIGPEIPQRFQRRYKGRFSEHRRQFFKFKCQQFLSSRSSSSFSAVLYVRYPRYVSYLYRPRHERFKTAASYSRYTNLSYFHLMYKSSCKLSIQ